MKEGEDTRMKYIVWQNRNIAGASYLFMPITPCTFQYGILTSTDMLFEIQLFVAGQIEAPIVKVSGESALKVGIQLGLDYYVSPEYMPREYRKEWHK